MVYFYFFFWDCICVLNRYFVGIPCSFAFICPSLVETEDPATHKILHCHFTLEKLKDLFTLFYWCVSPHSYLLSRGGNCMFDLSLSSLFRKEKTMGLIDNHSYLLQRFYYALFKRVVWASWLVNGIRATLLQQHRIYYFLYFTSLTWYSHHKLFF